MQLGEILDWSVIRVICLKVQFSSKGNFVLLKPDHFEPVSNIVSVL